MVGFQIVVEHDARKRERLIAQRGAFARRLHPQNGAGLIFIVSSSLRDGCAREGDLEK